MFAGTLVIYLGRLVTVATGGGSVSLREEDGPYNACVNLLLLVSLGWSGWQYGALTQGYLSEFSWMPAWGGFAAGMALSTLTQLIQARALRMNSPKRTYNKFVRNRRNRIDEQELESLVDVGQATGREYNSAGMARLRMFGIFAIAAWVAEFIVQSLNAPWGQPWFGLSNIAVLCWVIVATFLFELMAMLDQEEVD